MKINVLSSLVCLFLLIMVVCREEMKKPIQTRPELTQANQVITAFGEGGQIKMLYDRRQRPQSIYLNNKVHIVFNAGGQIGASPKALTKPIAVTYDPATRKLVAATAAYLKRC